MIRYTNISGTELHIPENHPDEDLIEHTAIAFGFLLNTSTAQGHWHSWAEFADLIAGYCEDDRALALVEVLRAL